MAYTADPTTGTGGDDDARRQALLGRLTAAQTGGNAPMAGDNPNAADNPGPSDSNTAASAAGRQGSLGAGTAPDQFSAAQNVLSDRTGAGATPSPGGTPPPPGIPQLFQRGQSPDAVDRNAPMPISPSFPTPTPPRPSTPIDEGSLRIAAGLGGGGLRPTPPIIPAPTQQQDAPPSSAQLGITAQQAARVLPSAPNTPAPAPTNGFAPQPLGFGSSPFAPQPISFTAPVRPVNDVAPGINTPTAPPAPVQNQAGTLQGPPQAPGSTNPDATSRTVAPGTFAAPPVRDVAPSPTGITAPPSTPSTPSTVTTPTQSDVIKTILGGLPATSTSPAAAPATPAATGGVAPIVETAKTPFQIAQQVAAGNTPAAAAPTGVQSQSAAGIGAASSAIQSLQAELAKSGNTPEAAMVFTQQLQGILAMINQQEAQLRADAAKNGSTIDTATQTALDQLKKTLENNLKTTQEDLNRRGLYQSGILLDLEQKLRTGNMTAEASLLGKRLDEIEKNLQANLQALGKERIGAMREFGLRGAEAEFQAGQNDQNRRERLITEMARLQGEQERQSRQFAFQQAEQARLFAHEDHSAAERRAFDAAQAQQKNQFDLMLETQKERAAAALQGQRIAAGEFSHVGRGGGGGTVGNGNGGGGGGNGGGGNLLTRGEAKGQATTEAINKIGQFDNMTDALNSLRENRRGMEANGIDTAVVLQAIQDRFASAAANDGRRRVGGPQ